MIMCGFLSCWCWWMVRIEMIPCRSQNMDRSSTGMKADYHWLEAVCGYFINSQLTWIRRGGHMAISSIHSSHILGEGDMWLFHQFTAHIYCERGTCGYFINSHILGDAACGYFINSQLTWIGREGYMAISSIHSSHILGGGMWLFHQFTAHMNWERGVYGYFINPQLTYIGRGTCGYFINSQHT